MNSWTCQRCENINAIKDEDLDVSCEFHCKICKSLHIVEELCGGELYVEIV